MCAAHRITVVYFFQLMYFRFLIVAEVATVKAWSHHRCNVKVTLGEEAEAAPLGGPDYADQSVDVMVAVVRQTDAARQSEAVSLLLLNPLLLLPLLALSVALVLQAVASLVDLLLEGADAGLFGLERLDGLDGANFG
jgi:hypothetical protein